jgi:hypothetical protein
VESARQGHRHRDGPARIVTGARDPRAWSAVAPALTALAVPPGVGCRFEPGIEPLDRTHGEELNMRSFGVLWAMGALASASAGRGDDTRGSGGCGAASGHGRKKWGAAIAGDVCADAHAECS